MICIEEEWAKRVVDGIAKTGKPVTGFGIELHGDHDTILRASKVAKEYVQWASELQRVECPISDLWVSTKCGESDTTSGCGSNPTVGSAFDKLEPLGVTMCFGETTEITGGENIVADRCATPRGARAVHDDVQPLPGGGRAPQDRATSPIRSRPRATSPAASPRSRRRRSATSRRSARSAR